MRCGLVENELPDRHQFVIFCKKSHSQLGLALNASHMQQSQREYTDLITVYKLIHGMMGVSLDDTGLKLSSNCTRSGGTRLQQLQPTTTLCASRFKFRAASMWNSLPWEAYQLPRLAMFKSYVKQKLLNDDQAYFD